MKTFLHITLIALFALLSLLASPGSEVGRVEAAVGPVITDYYTPCRGWTEGRVMTWHGQNRDGLPPYDPDRRTYDFRCENEAIYSPHGGVVYGVTPKYGGVVLVDDAVNGVCMVFLGMKTIAVEPNTEIEVGTFIGTYRLFHFSAVDGNCAAANWYDVPARERERPVAFIELGEVIPPDIRRPDYRSFISRNPMQGAVKPIDLRMPGLTEPQPQAVELALADLTEALYYYISVDPELCSVSGLGSDECPMAVIGVSRPLKTDDRTREGLIKAVMTEILLTKQPEIGPFKLLNPIYYSSLRLEGVSTNYDGIVIALTGEAVVPFKCGALQIMTQIEATLAQFGDTESITITLNGDLLADALMKSERRYAGTR